MRWPWVRRKEHARRIGIVIRAAEEVADDRVDDEVIRLAGELERDHAQQVVKMMGEVRDLRRQVGRLMAEHSGVVAQYGRDRPYRLQVEVSLDDLAVIGWQDEHLREMKAHHLIVQVWRKLRDANFVQPVSPPPRRVSDPWHSPGVRYDSWEDIEA